MARNSASDANLVGLGMELDAIAAVAVGGTLLTGGRANILGTLLGACVIQLVRYTLLANGVPDAAALVVKAGLIVLAVFIQQTGGQGIRDDATIDAALYPPPCGEGRFPSLRGIGVGVKANYSTPTPTLRADPPHKGEGKTP